MYQALWGCERELRGSACLERESLKHCCQLRLLSATAATLSDAHLQVVLLLESDVHVGRKQPMLPSQPLHNLGSNYWLLVLLKSVDTTCAIENHVAAMNETMQEHWQIRGGIGGARQQHALTLPRHVLKTQQE